MRGRWHRGARGDVARRAGLSLCLALALVGCGAAGRQLAGRAAVGAALLLTEAAINGAIEAGERRRDEAREQPTWRYDTLPPVRDAPESPYEGTLNVPGLPPLDEDLRRAFERMHADLATCAPPGAGRLVVEAKIRGTTRQAVRSRLFGAAAPVVDVDCIDRALATLRFEPFRRSVVEYWTIRY